MYSVEWQNGVATCPHTTVARRKIRPDAIDTIISAELPDKTEDHIIRYCKTHDTRTMRTLNRNSPCMQEGHCSKDILELFSEQTISGENGYPLYRRKSPQHGGFTAKIRLRGQEIDLDNRWVMPYSPVLSRTFKLTSM
ncbi:hypothetical protein EVAR_77897_1 [Eumeta japonica]|uniref:Uncharacterized protein n=1 Tax=Eumeta variegata TaxID=151549 RepID=A0A4C1ZF56_EUMVA|nr:hypothetical protein EVAR_77897_1 [Eumeta japonica]